MFSICNGAFDRSPPNGTIRGTILWKLYDGNILFNLWLLSGKLWYYGMVSYYSFKAIVPRQVRWANATASMLKASLAMLLASKRCAGLSPMVKTLIPLHYILVCHLNMESSNTSTDEEPETPKKRSQ